MASVYDRYLDELSDWVKGFLPTHVAEYLLRLEDVDKQAVASISMKRAFDHLNASGAILDPVHLEVVLEALAMQAVFLVDRRSGTR